jgi:hypothetical protein
MAPSSRRLVTIVLAVLLIVAGGWIYFHSLVPAVHPDHDHGLENIAGGGFLRVERVEGGTRNLVGRPGRVLILHWFELGSPAAMNELPSLVDYAASVAGDRDIEVVLVASGQKREDMLQWARSHGLPTANLYVDRESKTARLIGVRRIPETFIYDPEGRLAHQARGPMNWADPQLRATIDEFKHGVGEHQH